jgi:tetratricopeptide (TPR) repeat protein
MKRRAQRLRSQQRTAQLLGSGSRALQALPSRGTAGLSDALLAQCREQWQQGQWQQLAELQLSDIEQHTHRDRLALMLASAHLALGQLTQARLCVEQARDWDCDPRLIARALLAGVHNTLGRAAALGGQLERAWQHFALAAAPAAGARARTLALQSRGHQQLRSLGLALDPSAAPALSAALPQVLAAPLQALQQQAGVLQQGLAEQAGALQQLRQGLESKLQQGLEGALQQFEAYSNLQHYVQGGELMPAMHGWPVSPDFALLLVQALEEGEHDAVIEFGSGSSTQLIARVLRRRAGDRVSRPHLAFEHLPEFHARTAALLQRSGLRDQVELVLAPLTHFVTAAGDVQPYYDGLPALQDLAARLQGLPAPRLLLVVDGPPADAAPLARYPALELVLRALQPASIDVLLDDYARADEGEVVRRWREWMRGHRYQNRLTEHRVEKGACTIHFWRS